MPSGCVQCVMTSPPYWGMRDYGVPLTVWDGEPECVHEWGKTIDSIKKQDHRGNETSTLRGGRISPNEPWNLEAGQAGTPSQFCVHCGAWLGALGLEPSPELYVQHLVTIFHEVRRVLRDDGTLWLNLGDTYWGGKGKSGYELPHEAEARRARGKTLQAAHNVPGYMSMRPADGKHPILKPKDLVGIPWRVAFALQADGWWLRSDIIWNKPNKMPESMKDRPTNAHEYVFLLSKSGSPLYWTHRDHAGARAKPKPDYRWIYAVTGEETAEEPLGAKIRIFCPDCQGTGWTTTMAMTDLFGEIVVSGTIRCERCEKSRDHTVLQWKRVNLWQGHDYFYDQDAIRVPHKWEHVGGYRLGKESKNQGSVEKPVQGKGNTTGSFRAFAEGGRNKRTVWTIPTKSFKGAHFATFPEKLVEPCVLAGTSAKGCCPECGAAWARVVKKTGHVNRREAAYVPNHTPTKTDSTKWAPTAMATDQWRPTCSCQVPYGDLSPIPCVVFDPFVGAGTVPLVAKKWHRHYIGADINPSYVKMSRKRIATVQPRLF